MTKSSISNIESGLRNLTEKNIKLICQQFNVNEEWLRTGEGIMFKSEGDMLELIASKLDDMDEMDRAFITEYLKLNSSHRKVIKEFIRKMAAQSGH